MEVSYDYEGLAKRAAQLFAEDASRSDVIEEILLVKQQLTVHYWGINRAISILDSIAAAVAPDMEIKYENGAWIATPLVTYGSATVGPAATFSFAAAATDRKGHILELAAAAVLDEGVVRTQLIAERLKAEGAVEPISDLRTSVGNYLSRADGWKRVKPGEYAYGEEQEV